jgi:hypothetical protein
MESFLPRQEYLLTEPIQDFVARMARYLSSPRGIFLPARRHLDQGLMRESISEQPACTELQLRANRLP